MTGKQENKHGTKSQPVKTRPDRPTTEKTGTTLSRRIIMNASTTTIFTGLFSLCIFSPVVAADFSGSLKAVTITDLQASNRPPVAIFTSTANGGTVNFDASGSTDSDGSINSYKWDFGDGATGNGVTVAHQFGTILSSPVTLTVIDDSGGVGIVQQSISTLPAKWLQDSFTETTTTVLTAHKPDIGDAWTMANIDSQPFNVSGGKGYVLNSLASGDIAINTATPTGNDYSVTVSGILNSTSYDRLFGACGRFDTVAKTGYCAYLKGNGDFILAQYTGSSTVYGAILKAEKVTIDPYQQHTISLSFSGSKITGTLSGVVSINSDNSAYFKGGAGFILRRNNSFIYSIEAN